MSSILWPNAIDTLYFAINGKNVLIRPCWPARIGAKMAEDSVFVGRIPTERKQFVYDDVPARCSGQTAFAATKMFARSVRVRLTPMCSQSTRPERAPNKL